MHLHNAKINDPKEYYNAILHDTQYDLFFYCIKIIIEID